MYSNSRDLAEAVTISFTLNTYIRRLFVDSRIRDYQLTIFVKRIYILIFHLLNTISSFISVNRLDCFNTINWIIWIFFFSGLIFDHIFPCMGISIFFIQDNFFDFSYPVIDKSAFHKPYFNFRTVCFITACPFYFDSLVLFSDI